MKIPVFFERPAAVLRCIDKWLCQLPSRCPLCLMPASGGLLCKSCEADTFEARQQRKPCLVCGAEAHTKQHGCTGGELAAMVCALDYRLLGQSLIHMYKEGKQLALARLLGELMVRAAQPVLDRYHPDAWVPIPASSARLLRTGFSPAQQLARVVSAQTAVACRLDWLRQIREDAPQKTLNRAHRALAVKHRYVASDAVAGRCIGLIDDVVTTGSTVQAAASALKAAGARQVFVLAAARTPERT